MTITRFGQGEIVTTIHADQRQSADPPTNRGNDTRAAKQTKFAASWKRRLLDFFTITSEFRPPKAIEKGFLGQLWRRGAHYNNAATFRALIEDTSQKKFDFDALNNLTKDQAHRLRQNLLNHGELERAISAIRRGLSQCPDAPFISGLDALTTNLKHTFRTLSEKSDETGNEGRYDARKQDRLERMLWATAAKKPVEALTSKGVIKRKDVEELYSLCLLKSGSEVQDNDVRQFGEKFMAAPQRERQIVSEYLMKAIDEEAKKDDAEASIYYALKNLEGVEKRP
jgi:hypothetical protein